MKDKNTRPTLTFDVAKYEAMLDAPELTPDQRREMLQAIWDLIVSFVDLGFTVEPAPETCGQVMKTPGLNAGAAPHAVECKGAFGTALEDGLASSTKGATL